MTVTSKMGRDKTLKILIGAAIALFCFILYLYNLNVPSHPCFISDNIYSIPGFTSEEEGHLRASNLSLPKLPYKWYTDNCFPNGPYGRSINDVHSKVNILRASPNKVCREISELFDSFYRLEETIAPLVLPEPFKKKVLGWLNNSTELFEQIPNQKVYKIINKWTFEESVYNPLRSKRPTSKSDIDPVEYIENLVSSTKNSCDFCSYKHYTADDIFGRVDNRFSASASNTFKLAKFHGLFFPKSHHPLEINYTVLADLFLNTSQQWFEKAHQSDAKQIYPSLLWDSLPHAGASQVHPHVHGLLGENQYAGLVESMHSVAKRYYNAYRRSYWTDIALVHWALGLAVQNSEAIMIVPLNSRKDHEYEIISETVNENAVKLLYRAIVGYKTNLNVYCWSGGGGYPVMSESKSGLPMVFRISSRGVCTSVSSDVSSLELYTVNNINTDLEKTFSSIQNDIDF